MAMKRLDSGFLSELKSVIQHIKNTESTGESNVDSVQATIDDDDPQVIVDDPQATRRNDTQEQDETETLHDGLKRSISNACNVQNLAAKLNSPHQVSLQRSQTTTGNHSMSNHHQSRSHGTSNTRKVSFISSKKNPSIDFKSELSDVLRKRKGDDGEKQTDLSKIDEAKQETKRIFNIPGKPPPLSPSQLREIRRPSQTPESVVPSEETVIENEKVLPEVIVEDINESSDSTQAQLDIQSGINVANIISGFNGVNIEDDKGTNLHQQLIPSANLENSELNDGVAIAAGGLALATECTHSYHIPTPPPLPPHLGNTFPKSSQINKTNEHDKSNNQDKSKTIQNGVNQASQIRNTVNKIIKSQSESHKDNTNHKVSKLNKGRVYSGVTHDSREFEKINTNKSQTFSIDRTQGLIDNPSINIRKIIFEKPADEDSNEVLTRFDCNLKDNKANQRNNRVLTQTVGSESEKLQIENNKEQDEPDPHGLEIAQDAEFIESPIESSIQVNKTKHLFENPISIDRNTKVKECKRNDSFERIPPLGQELSSLDRRQQVKFQQTTNMGNTPFSGSYSVIDSQPAITEECSGSYSEHVNDNKDMSHNRKRHVDKELDSYKGHSKSVEHGLEDDISQQYKPLFQKKLSLPRIPFSKLAMGGDPNSPDGTPVFKRGYLKQRDAYGARNSFNTKRKQSVNDPDNVSYSNPHSNPDDDYCLYAPNDVFSGPKHVSLTSNSLYESYDDQQRRREAEFMSNRLYESTPEVYNRHYERAPKPNDWVPSNDWKQQNGCLESEASSVDNYHKISEHSRLISYNNRSMAHSNEKNAHTNGLMIMEDDDDYVSNEPIYSEIDPSRRQLESGTSHFESGITSDTSIDDLTVSTGMSHNEFYGYKTYPPPKSETWNPEYNHTGDRIPPEGAEVEKLHHSPHSSGYNFHNINNRITVPFPTSFHKHGNDVEELIKTMGINNRHGSTMLEESGLNDNSFMPFRQSARFNKRPDQEGDTDRLTIYHTWSATSRKIRGKHDKLRLRRFPQDEHKIDTPWSKVPPKDIRPKSDPHKSPKKERKGLFFKRNKSKSPKEVTKSERSVDYEEAGHMIKKRHFLLKRFNKSPKLNKKGLFSNQKEKTDAYGSDFEVSDHESNKPLMTKKKKGRKNKSSYSPIPEPEPKGRYFKKNESRSHMSQASESVQSVHTYFHIDSDHETTDIDGQGSCDKNSDSETEFSCNFDEFEKSVIQYVRGGNMSSATSDIKSLYRQQLDSTSVTPLYLQEKGILNHLKCCLRCGNGNASVSSQVGCPSLKRTINRIKAKQSKTYSL
ncbi:unnamed protein product [Owenia fusiformis]|uniref:Uncharacterized protein n=1 Tax=Owenia fusiformis TaxID=6347 RepID=A0A8S4NJP1_OWEFU|nr:unnamed protein product [Owenia fusiformis]